MKILGYGLCKYVLKVVCDFGLSLLGLCGCGVMVVVGVVLVDIDDVVVVCLVSVFCVWVGILLIYLVGVVKFRFCL